MQIAMPVRRLPAKSGWMSELLVRFSHLKEFRYHLE